mmetsp:Transcript_61115/g.90660  ORF Transcript_61115/g.90660 Transcript_61115/m.90660 type:complete len:557 (-) Transcript_61115:47-1717(-)
MKKIPQIKWVMVYQRNPKKRRWRRNDPPKRHWVLQEKSEFREKMEAKKRRKIDPNAAAAFEDSSRVSNRYEGLPEYNTSQYVLISLGATVDPKTMEQQQQQQQQPPTKRVPEQLNITPVFGITSFSQPAKLKTLSMHEAEEAISNQRDNMTRYMMHGKMSKVGVGMDDAPPVRVGMRLGPPPKGGMAKARLLGKLVKKSGGDDEMVDDDDVMKDIAFRERKGGSGRARKELLDTMGDEGITVDADGVLGGHNDSEFGGRRRFGRLAVPNQKPKEENQGADGAKKGAVGDDGPRAPAAAGNDGLAMDEDFYQRDVGAEYEDMDYDANEQFDDDDVDVGETEIADEGGFATDTDDDDDDEECDDDELVGGIATSSGLKAMLAKARGETVPEAPSAEASAAARDDANKKSTAYNYDNAKSGAAASANDRSEDDKARKTPPPGRNTLGQVAEAAKKAKEEAEEKARADAEKKKMEPVYTGVEVDESGQRLITLQAIRREIWLHHGAIKSKKLMKIFNSTKKAPVVRQNRFKEVVRELCTIKQDAVEGNLLVLKQHYSNMG